MPKKEITLRIERVRMIEAADAIINILEEHNKRFPGGTLKKELVLDRIEDAIGKIRSMKPGGKYIPAVENKQVAIASRSFVSSKWTDICYLCAETGYFIIWNPPDESPGLRLGTLEEYNNQQARILSITSGIARYHNHRAGIIEDHGMTGTDLSVAVLRHKGKE